MHSFITDVTEEESVGGDGIFFLCFTVSFLSHLLYSTISTLSPIDKIVYDTTTDHHHHSHVYCMWETWPGFVPRFLYFCVLHKRTHFMDIAKCRKQVLFSGHFQPDFTVLILSPSFLLPEKQISHDSCFLLSSLCSLLTLISFNFHPVLDSLPLLVYFPGFIISFARRTITGKEKPVVHVWDWEFFNSFNKFVAEQYVRCFL